MHKVIIKPLLGISVYAAGIWMACVAVKIGHYNHSSVLDAFMFGMVSLAINQLIDRLGVIGMHVVSVKRHCGAQCSRSVLIERAFNVAGVFDDAVNDRIHAICSSRECNFFKEGQLRRLARTHGFKLEFVW